MSTMELQAVCLNHATCTAGPAYCACICHSPRLRKHAPRWFHGGARYGLGLGVHCACGWLTWGVSSGEVAAAWGRHAQEHQQ